METFPRGYTCISVLVRIQSILTNIINALQISDCLFWAWFYSLVKKNVLLMERWKAGAIFLPFHLSYKIMEPTCCTPEQWSSMTCFPLCDIHGWELICICSGRAQSYIQFSGAGQNSALLSPTWERLRMQGRAMLNRTPFSPSKKSLSFSVSLSHLPLSLFPLSYLPFFPPYSVCPPIHLLIKKHLNFQPNIFISQPSSFWAEGINGGSKNDIF